MVCGRKIAVGLPHQIFNAIYDCYPKMWDALVYGDEQQCSSFWEAVKDGPQFKSYDFS